MRRTLYTLLACGALASACKSTNEISSTTGFLSDYSKLEPAGRGLRFVDMSALAGYDRFILDPIQIYFHDPRRVAELDDKELLRMTRYLDRAIRAVLVEPYEVVDAPGPGVAHMRIALTDIDESRPVLNILPPTHLAGLGLGSAAMEAELLDSTSGKQIGAVVEAQSGKRLSLAGVKKWGDAKAVMDNWAGRLRKRLDEAHGIPREEKP